MTVPRGFQGAESKNHEVEACYPKSNYSGQSSTKETYSRLSVRLSLGQPSVGYVGCSKAVSHGWELCQGSHDF